MCYRAVRLRFIFADTEAHSPPRVQIVARVFHLKLEAFKTRLFSGSVWGPASFDVDTGTWRYRVDASDGTGFLISVIEFQQRCVFLR